MKMSMSMNELRCQHWSRVYAAAIGAGKTNQEAKSIADASMTQFNLRWGVS